MHSSQLPSRYLYKEQIKLNVLKTELSFQSQLILLIFLLLLMSLALSVNLTYHPHTPCSIRLWIFSFLSQYSFSHPSFLSHFQCHPPSYRYLSIISCLEYCSGFLNVLHISNSSLLQSKSWFIVYHFSISKAHTKSYNSLLKSPKYLPTVCEQNIKP